MGFALAVSKSSWGRNETKLAKEGNVLPLYKMSPVTAQADVNRW